MDTENFLRLIGRNRKVILACSAISFFIAAFFSYYYNGRHFRSGIEFYIAGSSFAEHVKDNTNSMLPAKQEMEVIKSLTSSSQLYHVIASDFELDKYYRTDSSNRFLLSEAENKLQTLTSIKVDEYGKISIFVMDIDKFQAFNLAHAMMEEINKQYNVLLNNFKKSQIEKFERQLNFYQKEKDSLMQNLAKVPVSVLNFEFNKDSVKYGGIKRLNEFASKNSVTSAEVLNVLNQFRRLVNVEDQVVLLIDQRQRYLDALVFTKKNILITNKYINYKPAAAVKEHLLIAVKVMGLTVLSVVSLIVILHYFRKELNMMFGGDAGDAEDVKEQEGK